jgi:hypothetical protein
MTKNRRFALAVVPVITACVLGFIWYVHASVSHLTFFAVSDVKILTDAANAARLAAQEATIAHPQQTFTGYPPSVYMGFFQACSADKPCTRTEDFRVDPVPKGCCVLIVTNGNGLGKDEVGSFEVSLNGKTVIPTDHSRNAQATVTVQTSNTIKLILTGEAASKVFVLIAYDPRQSK